MNTIEKQVVIIWDSINSLLMANMCQLYNLDFLVIKKTSFEYKPYVFLQQRTLWLLSKLWLLDKVKEKAFSIQKYKFSFYTKVFKEIDFKRYYNTYEKNVLVIPEKDLKQILKNNIVDFDQKISDLAFFDFKTQKNLVLLTVKDSSNQNILLKTNYAIYCADFDSNFAKKHNLIFEEWKSWFNLTEFLIQEDWLLQLSNQEKNLQDKHEIQNTQLNTKDLKKDFLDNNLNVVIFKSFLLNIIPVWEKKYFVKLASKSKFSKHEHYLNFALKKIYDKKYHSISVQKLRECNWHFTQLKEFRQRNFFIIWDQISNDHDFWCLSDNLSFLDIEKIAWMIKMDNNINFWQKYCKILFNIFEQEKKTDLNQIFDMNSKLKLILSDNFIFSLFKEYISSFRVQHCIIKKDFLNKFAWLVQNYKENALTKLIVPTLSDIISNIGSIHEFYKFTLYPKLWQRAPSWYVVLHANEPKVYWRRLNDDEKFVVLFFVGIDNKLDDTLIKQIDQIQQKYWKIIDCYIVNNNYDIAKHDDNNRILGDVNASLHKKYNSFDSSIYIIRSDWIITWKSYGFNIKSLIDYLNFLSKLC